MSADLIKDGDIILFKNFTDSKRMDIDLSVIIKPYSHLNEFKADLMLSNGSDKSTISGFNFNNANIKLNNVSDVLIILNNFTDSKITDNSGVDNSILNNSFVLKSNSVQFILFNDCLNDTFAFNDISMNSSNSIFIEIEKSDLTNIHNNSFDVSGDSVKLIASDLSNSTNLLYNDVNINASGNIYAYFANNETNDKILSNTILINDLTNTPIAVCYNNSQANVVKFNRINSYSIDAQDYAIVIDGANNTITNNYLISSNGFRRGDDAANSTLNNTVRDNLPVHVYVSVNGSDDGNGTFDNPYQTIKKAIEKKVGKPAAPAKKPAHKANRSARLVKKVEAKQAAK